MPAAVVNFGPSKDPTLTRMRPLGVAIIETVADCRPHIFVAFSKCQDSQG